MGRFWGVFIIISCVVFTSYGQNPTISAGLRLQKYVGFYWENGASIYYSSDQLLNGKLLLGGHIISSRVGSAFNSNAIKQEEYLISGHYQFRSQKKMVILSGISTGWFHANYENDLFSDLQNNSMALSVEFGLRYPMIQQLSFQPTFGYQIMSGTGDAGAGTLYPVYYQFTFLWNFQK